MKRYHIIGFFTLLSALLLCQSCDHWMDIYPTNEQVSPRFWQSKEDVEMVLGCGYETLRAQVGVSLIDWGELRASSLVARSNTSKQKLQDFKLTSDNTLCSWSGMYKVLNMANSVIQYAPQVQQKDETYLTSYMNGHIVEALFLRSLINFYLVRNWKEAPLVTKPYVDDSEEFDKVKSSEQDIIACIKQDIRTALSLNPKEYYDDDRWIGASKGRATKWALYALMADVCLWSEDYDECIEYCDKLLNAAQTSKSAIYPAFMEDPEQWFTIFYDGNTNESVFEINWQTQTYNQTNGSPSNIFTISSSSVYLYSTAMSARLDAEAAVTDAEGRHSVRAEWGAFATYSVGESQHLVWKYNGLIGEKDVAMLRSTKDANWIVYRMADVVLMKAEAMVWQGGHGQEALKLINRVRTRACLNPLSADVDIDTDNQLEMLQAILYERDIEFAAEGKRWYDLIRFGRSQDFKYKDKFIDIILENNATVSDSWIVSVLQDPDAWFLPVNQSELDVNVLLEQNPYYVTTSN